MLAMLFLHFLMVFGLFRVGKERLGRRETLVHLELLDQPASVGPPGTTVPRETLYVSSTNTQNCHARCCLMHNRTSDFDSDPSAGSSRLPRRPWPPWRARHSCK